MAELQTDEGEHPGTLTNRVRVIATFVLGGIVAGCLSGYFWAVSPHARYFPGPVFGIAMSILVAFHYRPRSVILPLAIICASSLGFYFATAIWTETGLPKSLDSVAVAVVGIAPLVLVMCFSRMRKSRGKFICILMRSRFCATTFRVGTVVAINPGVRSRCSRPRALELNAVGVGEGLKPTGTFLSRLFRARKAIRPGT